MKYILFFLLIIHLAACRSDSIGVTKRIVKIDPLLSNEIQLNSICAKIEIIPLDNIVLTPG